MPKILKALRGALDALREREMSDSGMWTTGLQPIGLLRSNLWAFYKLEYGYCPNWASSSYASSMQNLLRGWRDHIKVKISITLVRTDDGFHALDFTVM